VFAKNPWTMLSLVAILAIACGDEFGTRAAEQQPGSHPTSVRQHDPDPTMALRFQGAERVLIATVEHVAADFGKNEYGDDLILTTVTLRVGESLRGEASEVISFQLEGGTVGELTLKVSDMPTLQVGDHGVFALRRSRSEDTWVPNGRSLGILLADHGLDLDGVRQAERRSR